MKKLLKLALGIDQISEWLGRVAAFLVLLVATISAINAIVRMLQPEWTSNFWLEIQWYLFTAIVMLGAPVVLKLNEHVRVDILYGKYKGHWQVYIDVGGLALFLLPPMLIFAWLCLHFFMEKFSSMEMSSMAGGLVRWPVVLLLPLGFTVISLQGLSEIVKRVCFLRGIYEMNTHYEKPLQ